MYFHDFDDVEKCSMISKNVVGDGKQVIFED